jgi:hypothetical protein
MPRRRSAGGAETVMRANARPDQTRFCAIATTPRRKAATNRDRYGKGGHGSQIISRRPAERQAKPPITAPRRLFPGAT